MIIRYSMLQAYLECPKAFYDRYILGKIETERSSALEFGSALHLGIRTILERENGIEAFQMYWESIKSLHIQYYDQSWASLRELGEHFLTNFKTRHLKKFTEFEQEIQMEMPFVDMETNVTDKPIFLHTLQGTADYIGKYEGKFSIVDWKTSSKAYRDNKIELNLQMPIYALLYKHKTGVLPEQIVYKVFNKKTGSINTHKKELTNESIAAIFTCIENTARSMLRCIETKELYHGVACFCERL